MACYGDSFTFYFCNRSEISTLILHNARHKEMEFDIKLLHYEVSTLPVDQLSRRLVFMDPKIWIHCNDYIHWKGLIRGSFQGDNTNYKSLCYDNMLGKLLPMYSHKLLLLRCTTFAACASPLLTSNL
jgi:hypothetical protein